MAGPRRLGILKAGPDVFLYREPYQHACARGRSRIIQVQELTSRKGDLRVDVRTALFAMVLRA